MEGASLYGYKIRIILLPEESKFKEVMREVKSLKLSGLILSSYCGEFYIKKENIALYALVITILGIGMTIASLFVGKTKETKETIL